MIKDFVKLSGKMTEAQFDAFGAAFSDAVYVDGWYSEGKKRGEGKGGFFVTFKTAESRRLTENIPNTEPAPPIRPIVDGTVRDLD